MLALYGGVTSHHMTLAVDDVLVVELRRQAERLLGEVGVWRVRSEGIREVMWAQARADARA